MAEDRELHDSAFDLPALPHFFPFLEVIHKLSTARSKIGGEHSFPTCPRSVTMEWGKVGNFGAFL